MYLSLWVHDEAHRTANPKGLLLAHFEYQTVWGPFLLHPQHRALPKVSGIIDNGTFRWSGD